jgi:hypothetical protein
MVAVGLDTDLPRVTRETKFSLNESLQPWNGTGTSFQFNNVLVNDYWDIPLSWSCLETVNIADVTIFHHVHSTQVILRITSIFLDDDVLDLDLQCAGQRQEKV